MRPKKCTHMHTFCHVQVHVKREKSSEFLQKRKINKKKTAFLVLKIFLMVNAFSVNQSAYREKEVCVRQKRKGKEKTQLLELIMRLK